MSFSLLRQPPSLAPKGPWCKDPQEILQWFYLLSARGQSISRASSEASRLHGFQAMCGFLSSISCSKIRMVGFGRGGWAHLLATSSQAWALFISTDAHFDQLHMLHMDGKRSEDSEIRLPPPRLPALKEYFRAIPSFSLASFLPGND